MISWTLFRASTVATLIVIASFVLFAFDQAGEGSEQQVSQIERQIDAPAPGRRDEADREEKNTVVREAIDDANDFLVKPFVGVTRSSEIWVNRSVPGLLAFLVYGVLLRMFAVYARRLP